MIADYNTNAYLWKREAPNHLSELVGRPIIYAWVEEVGKGKVLIDAGCGEGYPTRVMRPFVKKAVGFDNAKSMIDLAKKDRTDIHYLIGDLNDFPKLPKADILTAHFSIHYVHPDNLIKVYNEIRAVLKKDGEFMIAIPHPLFFSKKKEHSHVFDEKVHYQRSRGKEYNMTIKTTTSGELLVGGYVTKLEDHINALSKAGLFISELREPVVSKELVEEFPVYKKLQDEILFLVFRGGKR